MATFLSSALALAALLQAPAAQTPATGTAADSLVALREHLARDSTDGHAWLLLGRLYLQRAADAHEPPHRALQDSAVVRALVDSDAAWYVRSARGLRPDVLTVPLAAWRGDSVLRGRMAADLKPPRHRDPDAALAGLAKRGPVCVTVLIDRPPGARIGWSTRPLVWVAGPHLKDDRVPPRDFVFAALRLALDGNDAWAPPALALYAPAARATPAPSAVLKTF